MLVWLNSSILLDRVNASMNKFMSYETASETGGGASPSVDPGKLKEAKIEALKAAHDLVRHLDWSK
jgi:hypothetical protein